MIAGDFLYILGPQAREKELRRQLGRLCREDMQNCRF
jgi:hypothetical protein